jgi:hypothetical protein
MAGKYLAGITRQKSKKFNENLSLGLLFLEHASPWAQEVHNSNSVLSHVLWLQFNFYVYTA